MGETRWKAEEPKTAIIHTRHVIHTTLIAFYDLISKTDTTVAKGDLIVNNMVIILRKIPKPP